jgi:putative membrane protein
MGSEEPDYRFTLANERTFLAWVRTSLAFLAGGLAVSELVDGSAPLRRTVAIALVLIGAVGPVLAHRRWASSEAAMRAGDPLPVSALPLMVTVVLVVVGVGAVVLVLAR